MLVSVLFKDKSWWVNINTWRRMLVFILVNLGIIFSGVGWRMVLNMFFLFPSLRWCLGHGVSIASYLLRLSRGSSRVVSSPRTHKCRHKLSSHPPSACQTARSRRPIKAPALLPWEAPSSNSSWAAPLCELRPIALFLIATSWTFMGPSRPAHTRARVPRTHAFRGKDHHPLTAMWLVDLTQTSPPPPPPPPVSCTSTAITHHRPIRGRRRMEDATNRLDWQAQSGRGCALWTLFINMRKGVWLPSKHSLPCTI